MGQANAELDDLVQEGMINVWERLRRGHFPKPEFIRFRMLSWVRYLHRQERGDSISYESAMENPRDWLLNY